MLPCRWLASRRERGLKQRRALGVQQPFQKGARALRGLWLQWCGSCLLPASFARLARASVYVCTLKPLSLAVEHIPLHCGRRQRLASRSGPRCHVAEKWHAFAEATSDLSLRSVHCVNHNRHDTRRACLARCVVVVACRSGRENHVGVCAGTASISAVSRRSRSSCCSACALRLAASMRWFVRGCKMQPWDISRKRATVYFRSVSRLPCRQ